MPTVHSAAVLQYTIEPDWSVMVFIAHMGGPFWARKEEGAWSLPKGEFDPENEDSNLAAAREFEEEIGVSVASADLVKLGEFKQSSGKVIHVFVRRGERRAVRFVHSNDFELEWPRGSGHIQRFPEVDRADWFSVRQARTKLVKGQRAILDALITHLRQELDEVQEGADEELGQQSLF